MTVGALRLSDRVCLRDRSASEPARYLTCPAARAGSDGECYVLVRRDDGVYGLCTDHVSWWSEDDREERIARLREREPATASVLESPERAAPWPVPEVSVDLFDRLAARGHPVHDAVGAVWLGSVCVPEENAGHRLQHLFEVGYVYAVQDPIYESDMAPSLLDYLRKCPGCARRTGFMGSYDGHGLRVYCRCGNEREEGMWMDFRDALVRRFTAPDPGFTWFREGNVRAEASVAQMRERGTREGWYPELITEHDEALLDEVMRSGHGATVDGEVAARELARQWLHALTVAETINTALDEHRKFESELRRLLRR